MGEPNGDMTNFLGLNKHIESCPITGCWLWTGVLRKGYARIKICGKQYSAHHITWLIKNKTIPFGLECDHLCRVRHCVNPDHLEFVTNSENVRRGERATKKICKHGHPFSIDNTYTYQRKDGLFMRICRECHNRRNRIYQQTHGHYI